MRYYIRQVLLLLLLALPVLADGPAQPGTLQKGPNLPTEIKPEYKAIIEAARQAPSNKALIDAYHQKFDALQRENAQRCEALMLELEMALLATTKDTKADDTAIVEKRRNEIGSRRAKIAGNLKELDPAGRHQTK